MINNCQSNLANSHRMKSLYETWNWKKIMNICFYSNIDNMMIPKLLWWSHPAGVSSPPLYLLWSGIELDRTEFQILIFLLAVSQCAGLSMRFSNRHFDVNGDLIYNVIFQLKCAYIIVSFSLVTNARGTKTTQLKTTEIR